MSFPSLKFVFLLLLYHSLICDDFNENFWNLQERLIQLRGTSRIFIRIFGSHSSPGTRFFAGKTWFWHCSNYETRDSGPPRARNLTFNSWIDRFQREKHLGIFLEFFFHTLSKNGFRKKEKKNTIQASKNVPKFVDSALQERQVRRKKTRPVNISEKYIWDFFHNSPFISRSRNDIQNIMKNVIMILFFIRIVRIQKISVFCHFVYTHMGWCRDE